MEIRSKSRAGPPAPEDFPEALRRAPARGHAAFINDFTNDRWLVTVMPRPVSRMSSVANRIAIEYLIDAKFDAIRLVPTFGSCD